MPVAGEGFALFVVLVAAVALVVGVAGGLAVEEVAGDPVFEVVIRGFEAVVALVGVGADALFLVVELPQ